MRIWTEEEEVVLKKKVERREKLRKRRIDYSSILFFGVLPFTHFVSRPVAIFWGRAF